MRLHYKFKYELAQIADPSAAQERTFKIQLVWVLIFFTFVRQKANYICLNYTICFPLFMSNFMDNIQ